MATTTWRRSPGRTSPDRTATGNEREGPRYHSPTQFIAGRSSSADPRASRLDFSGSSPSRQRRRFIDCAASSRLCPTSD